MKTRWAIYINGYVNEDLSIKDPLRIDCTSSTFDEAKMVLIKYCIKHNTDISDYHIHQEQKENIGWVSVEGTETYF